MHRGRLRQGVLLVRQRVGLLEPLRRARRQGARARARRRLSADLSERGSFAKASVRDAPVDGAAGARRGSTSTCRSRREAGPGRRRRHPDPRRPADDRAAARARRARRPRLAPRPAEGPRARALDGAGRGAPRRAARRREVAIGPGRGRRRRSRRRPRASGPASVLLLENSRFEPGETKQRPGAGAGARPARRPLRRRRLRRRAPRARDHRGRRPRSCPATRGCCWSARCAS